MLRMCVYMHSRFVENHPIQILEDGPLISEGVLSHTPCVYINKDVSPFDVMKPSCFNFALSLEYQSRGACFSP
jgi:hypothetical protein